MTRPILAAALIIYNLLAVSTGVGATCMACPNCDYERISIQQGDACLNYWTCSGDTITCYYPSVANPGTFTSCSYSGSSSWALTAGPSDICFSVAGDNSKCLPPNDPYNNFVGCTASYGYDGGVNSGLLKKREQTDELS
ncbi:hypothetical protein DEU56DRAFT_405476 [Suillus clintonianus]|uniref:uncharacterized protein n=1 Tax=Suillus clintonianus TaxID=1904413 RepID=UPI001B8632F4|nr:uncharacterized protein DEU56DRAFT_405476 [Suillus clintonianus]KAG2134835.1 hypothetical protein DEU56DRAFT_405476 [Suillus clintonianus]